MYFIVFSILFTHFKHINTHILQNKTRFQSKFRYIYMFINFLKVNSDITQRSIIILLMKISSIHEFNITINIFESLNIYLLYINLSIKCP